MDSLERRIFLTGLRLDFSTVANWESWGFPPPRQDPVTLGHCLVPAYRNGELDAAVMKGGI